MSQLGSSLRDDLYAAHAALTRDVLTAVGAGGDGTGDAADRLAAWAERNSAALAHIS
jgi:glutamate dehydrogenase